MLAVVLFSVVGIVQGEREGVICLNEQSTDICGIGCGKEWLRLAVCGRSIMLAFGEIFYFGMKLQKPNKGFIGLDP